MKITNPRATRRSFLAQAAAGSLGLALGARATWAASSTPTERWQIGCYTRPWDDQDYLVALDAIAEAGYRYVGLMTAGPKPHVLLNVNSPAKRAREVGQACRTRGLRVASLYGGGIPVARSLQAGIDGLRRLIDHCVACGARNLLMGGLGQKELFDPYYRAIAACCDEAAEKGVGISIKPHGGLNATGPQCRRIIERVNHPNFRIWYDPGNILYYSDGKLDPVEDASTVRGLVTGMCVKDYRHPKNVMVTPGTGQVDFPGVMRKLWAGGFHRGPLVVETLARVPLEKRTAEARKTRRWLEQLVQGLG